MSPNPRRGVLITGASAHVQPARDLEDLWAALRDDLAPPTSADRLDPGALATAADLSTGDAGVLGRHQLLALLAVESSWRIATLPAERNRLRGEGPKARHPRWAVCGGTSFGGLAELLDNFDSWRRADAGKLSPYSMSVCRGNAVTAAVSVRFGLGGGDHSLNSASATGGQALWWAGQLVRHGLADLVVAVASDAPHHAFLHAMMGRNRSLSRSGTSRPLSVNRDGMVPVEGAACVILETERHAAQRGATPLAVWEGGISLSEARHLAAPQPDGATLCEAVNLLLRETSREPRDIDWVSLHATGTRRFDSAEVSALRALFGDRLPWLSAMKRSTGHSMGAAGLVEAALLVEGLRRAEVPAWPRDVDRSLAIPATPPPRPSPPRLAMQLSQGMGGVVVANLLSRTAR